MGFIGNILRSSVGFAHGYPCGSPPGFCGRDRAHEIRQPPEPAATVQKQTLTRIFHALRSRRRESAERLRLGTRPPTHVGGYSLAAFCAACEMSGLKVGGKTSLDSRGRHICFFLLAYFACLAGHLRSRIRYSAKWMTNAAAMASETHEISWRLPVKNFITT